MGDFILIIEYLNNKGRWIKIAKSLIRRNGYQTKNRFFSLLKKFNIQKEDEKLCEKLEKGIFDIVKQTKINQMKFSFENTQKAYFLKNYFDFQSIFIHNFVLKRCKWVFF